MRSTSIDEKKRVEAYPLSVIFCVNASIGSLLILAQSSTDTGLLQVPSKLQVHGLAIFAHKLSIQTKLLQKVGIDICSCQGNRLNRVLLDLCVDNRRDFYVLSQS